jgi:hypothetical protein
LTISSFSPFNEKLRFLGSLPLEKTITLKMVKPILLYGCEVWGFSNNDIIEKVHLKFCKLLLHLKSSTPSYMIYGELGRYPLEIDIKSRIISFWAKLLSGKELKLSKIIYNLCYCMSIKNVEHFTWLDNVKKILNECGFASTFLLSKISKYTSMPK